MNVLPQAIASGYIHIGTIAGKLNGVMPAHDAERLADRVAVDVGRDVLRELTLQEVGKAAGELDDLEPATHFSKRVGENLAVLPREDLGDVALVAFDELAEGEHDSRPRGEGSAAPRARRLRRRVHRRVDDRRIRKGDTRAPFAVSGVVEIAPAFHCAVPRLAANPVAHGLQAGAVATDVWLLM